MPAVSVALLPGDGIGPEVVAEAVRVIDAIAPDHDLTIRWHEHLMGGVSIDAHGTALTDEVLAACAESDAVLLGAVGGRHPDDGRAGFAIEIGHGNQGQRPAGAVDFGRDIVMRFVVGDDKDQRTLIIGPAAMLDPGKFAKR